MKDPMFNGRFDPDDILEMIRQKVPQIKILEEPLEEMDERVKELADMTDRKEKEVPLPELPVDDQYKILRNQVLRRMGK